MLWGQDRRRPFCPESPCLQTVGIESLKAKKRKKLQHVIISVKETGSLYEKSPFQIGPLRPLVSTAHPTPVSCGDVNIISYFRIFEGICWANHTA